MPPKNPWPASAATDARAVPPRFAVRPLSLRAANAFVQEHHRHHRPVQGGKFSLAVTLGDGDAMPSRIVGVVIAGRPVARHLDDGWTLEVTRLCTDGTANACSKLYAGRLPRGTRVGLHAPHHLHAAGRGRRQPAGARLAPGRTVATGTERAGRARTPPRRCACPSWCGRRRSGEAWRLLPMRTAAGADCRSRACRRSATLGPCSADFGQQHARAVSIFKTATRFRPR